MRKIVRFYEFWEELTKPIQICIYIFAGGLLIGALVGFLFFGKGCDSTDTIETVKAEYFMNQTVKVHEGYEVKVNYAKTVDSISYMKEKHDTEKTTLQGNYILVNLDLTRNLDSTARTHDLDVNDFKLRDHNGVYLPLNDIGSLIDMDMFDVHFITDENGSIISEADFDNKNAIKDYTWVGKELINGETINLTLFFEMKEGYKVEEDLMLLEVDFYYGIGNKKGEDIVLANYKTD